MATEKHHAEQRRGQETTLLDSVGGGKPQGHVGHVKIEVKCLRYCVEHTYCTQTQQLSFFTAILSKISQYADMLFSSRKTYN